jgi:hypothetical protein
VKSNRAYLFIIPFFIFDILGCTQTGEELKSLEKKLDKILASQK